MTLQYFDPDYELTIGVKKFSLDKNNPIYKDAVDIQDTLTLKDFQIDFRAALSSSAGSNIMSLTICNPPDKLYNGLKGVQGKKPFIRLKAGFKNGKVDQIFLGNIDKIDASREGVNNKIVLTCSDGSFNIREGYSVRSYPAGTQVQTIIRDIAEDMVVPISFNYDFNENLANIPTEIPYAMSFSQNSFQALTNFTQSLGLESTYVQSKLLIYKQNLFQKVTIATKISPDTGLVGSVAYASNGSEFVDDTTVEKDGIKFKCLLNGAIMPESYIEVVSDNIKGIYKVVSVVHEGSFEGSSWFSTVTCAGSFEETEVPE